MAHKTLYHLTNLTNDQTLCGLTDPDVYLWFDAVIGSDDWVLCWHCNHIASQVETSDHDNEAFPEGHWGRNG